MAPPPREAWQTRPSSKAQPAEQSRKDADTETTVYVILTARSECFSVTRSRSTLGFPSPPGALGDPTPGIACQVCP